MKENKYDDEIFFEKYAEMKRSKDGLTAAGEWDTLKNLLPDFKDKRVLDLGCGYGWHCDYAAQNGAEYVLGIDISQKMLDEAKHRNCSPKVKYVRAAMEDAELGKAEFDVVLSSLAFHYVSDFDAVIKKIYACLKPDGVFIFSAEHPVFTAYGSQDWYYNVDGKILHFPVDNYFYEGEREANFLGEKVVKYHRTLTSYVNTLLDAGFTLQNLIEPQPPEKLMGEEGMRDEMRRPMMLIIKAVKK